MRAPAVVLSTAIALLGLAAVPPAHAKVEWCVTTTNLTRAAPNPMPGGRMLGKGYHNITITKFGIEDTVFPIVFGLPNEGGAEKDGGRLLRDQGILDTCWTGMVPWLGGERTTLTCTTSFDYQPCYGGMGLWESISRGRLEGHPAGGTKTSLPSVANPGCYC